MVLAVMFVALALILNSAIFTENLASRGETTGGDDVIEYRSDLQHGVGAILRYENRNISSGEGHGDVTSRLKTGIGDANEMLMRQHAKHGAISNVSLESTGKGARIYQTDGSRNFTNATGQTDWTVVEDVDRTRAFRIGVRQSTLPNCGLLSDCFILTVSDGSDEWKVSISNEVDGVVVAVDNGTGSTESCDAVDEPTVEIDLTAGTVGGEDCSALSFGDAPDSGYDVGYQNADKINGTYSFVVDNESIATSPPTHFDPGSDPSVSPALYNVTLAYEYETVDVAVESEIPVAPGEPDE